VAPAKSCNILIGGIAGRLRGVALACSVTCEMAMRGDRSSLQLPVRLGACRGGMGGGYHLGR
jgi:hypothetical protein